MSVTMREIELQKMLLHYLAIWSKEDLLIIKFQFLYLMSGILLRKDFLMFMVFRCFFLTRGLAEYLSLEQYHHPI